MSDLIERQAAIDVVKVGALSTAMLYGRTEEGETARKEIERLIKDLPSVSTEKTGRWIDQGYKEEWWAEYYKCSECGYGMVGVDNYCPNCGCKMEVEE